MSDSRPAWLTTARAGFHATLLTSGVLTIDANGVPSNADKSQRSSVLFARSIADRLLVEVGGTRLPGQTSGGQFEAQCATFLGETFPRLGVLRPGDWFVQHVTSRSSTEQIARFEQFEHLRDLNDAIVENPQLRAVLGNGYVIAPDVVIGRRPVTDAFINSSSPLVDDQSALHAPIRQSNQQSPILHAVVSCKWTLRSDRAQNARSEALNLVRNRKGRLPHVVVITGEPSPSRISSLALGTGDIDCVYHFALPELQEAVAASQNDEAMSLLDTMVTGKRLRDIADLPLDLAI